MLTDEDEKYFHELLNDDKFLELLETGKWTKIWEYTYDKNKELYANLILLCWKVGLPSDPALQRLGSHLFGDLDILFPLKTLNIPEGIEDIGENCFYDYDIEEVIIPHSVDTIGTKAFSYTGVRKLTICNKNVHIMGDVFYGCDTLQEINFMGSKAEWTKLNNSVKSWGTSNKVRVICDDGDLLMKLHTW